MYIIRSIVRLWDLAQDYETLYAITRLNRKKYFKWDYVYRNTWDYMTCHDMRFAMRLQTATDYETSYMRLCHETYHEISITDVVLH